MINEPPWCWYRLLPFSPLAFFLSCLIGFQRADAYGELDQFLIVSSSVTHQVAYAYLPRDKLPGQVKLKVLISSGLTFPQGMAVDPYRRHLYVADPTIGSLVYYELEPSGDRLYVGKQQVAASGVEVRWVTVDTLGNVYFTVENTQNIMRISAAKIDSGNTSPDEVYKAGPIVSAPAGIAMDNYFVYWANKMNPHQAGTIVRTPLSPSTNQELAPLQLSHLNAKCYGVCLAVRNVFFTDETKNLYGIDRLGGDKAVRISSSFQEARGCAWDGQNVVYVADKKANAVYSFPAMLPSLRENISMTLVANMEGAYGVAVFTVSQMGGALSLSPSLLVNMFLPVAAALLACFSGAL